MSLIDDFFFEPIEAWEQLPADIVLGDVAGIAVDSKDRVYLFNRGEHPVVVLGRDGVVVTITADPAEGESFTEAGLELAERTVETVPMPPSLATLLADFVVEHHVERVFHKRRRDQADREPHGRGTTLDDES